MRCGNGDASLLISALTSELQRWGIFKIRKIILLLFSCQRWHQLRKMSCRKIKKNCLKFKQLLSNIHIYICTYKCWLSNTAIMIKASSFKCAGCSSLNHNTDINMRSWLSHLLPRGGSEMLVYSGLDHLSHIVYITQCCWEMQNSWSHCATYSWLRLCKRQKRSKSQLIKVLGAAGLPSINHYDCNLRHYRHL